jgi:hypothetical protein
VERTAAVAVGRLSPSGPWVGFAETDAGYELVFGDGERVRGAPQAETRRRDLLSVALLYFGDAAEPGPEELVATHGDVGDLVRWLASAAPGERERRKLQAAVDAIDDGLAADAVMLRLEEAAASMTMLTETEQADPLDLLAERYANLLR